MGQIWEKYIYPHIGAIIAAILNFKQYGLIYGWINIKNEFSTPNLVILEVLHDYMGKIGKKYVFSITRQPSKPPSWISQIAQGYTLVIRQSSYKDPSRMQNPKRKKLYQPVHARVPKVGLATRPSCFYQEQTSFTKNCGASAIRPTYIYAF